MRSDYILALTEYNQKLSEVINSFALTQEQQDQVDNWFDQLLKKKLDWKLCLVEIKTKLSLPEAKSLDLAADFFGFGFWPISKDYSRVAMEWLTTQKRDWKKYQEWSDYLHEPYFRFRDDFENIFSLVGREDFTLEQKIAISNILMSTALNIGTPQRALNNLLQADLTASAALDQDQATRMLSIFLDQPDLGKFTVNNQLELYSNYAQELDETFKNLALDTTDLESLTNYLTEAIDDEDGIMTVLWWRWVFQNNLVKDFIAKSWFIDEVLIYYQTKYPNLSKTESLEVLILLIWRYIFVQKLGFKDDEAALIGQYLIKHGSGLNKLVYYDEQKDRFCWADIKEENGKLVISAIGGSAYGGSR